MPETTPDKAVSKPSSEIGQNPASTGKDKYFFGTPEEINNRVSTGYPGGEDPGFNAPHFTQIPPSVGGKDANNPGLDDKSGSIKFSGGLPGTDAG